MIWYDWHDLNVPRCFCRCVANIHVVNHSWQRAEAPRGFDNEFHQLCRPTIQTSASALLLSVTRRASAGREEDGLEPGDEMEPLLLNWSNVTHSAVYKTPPKGAFPLAFYVEAMDGWDLHRLRIGRGGHDRTIFWPPWPPPLSSVAMRERNVVGVLLVLMDFTTRKSHFHTQLSGWNTSGICSGSLLGWTWLGHQAQS